MNSYIVSENGEKLCIDEDLFDAMWNSLETDDEIHHQRKLKKKARNDRLNAKYREEGYFKNYFKKTVMNMNVKDAVVCYPQTQ